MKEIPLTQGKVALVDDADFEVASKFKWCALKKDNNWYAVRGQHVPETQKTQMVYLHRFLLDFPKGLVDHKDKNGLNCQRENMRPATRSQNAGNCRKPKTGWQSLYRGVDKTKSGKWAAKIKHLGVGHCLGTFEWEIQAALAYDRESVRLRGEFSSPNIAALLPPKTGPRVLIIGAGRSGKDEVALSLHGHGTFNFCGSTSWMALPFVARQLGIPEQWAWDTRHQKREFWFQFCCALRGNDPSFLVKLALQTGSVVSGIRDKVEIEDAVKLFDGVWWVNRPGIPEDPTLTFDPAMFASDIIVNDGTLEQLREKAVALATLRGWL